MAASFPVFANQKLPVGTVLSAGRSVETIHTRCFAPKAVLAFERKHKKKPTHITTETSGKVKVNWDFEHMVVRCKAAPKKS